MVSPPPSPFRFSPPYYLPNSVPFIFLSVLRKQSGKKTNKKHNQARIKKKNKKAQETHKLGVQGG